MSHDDDTPDGVGDASIRLILAGLTASQKHVIRVGRTYSSAQRARLIDKGVADPCCRGWPPLPRQADALSRCYDLPLTELGLLLRARLSKRQT